MDKNWMEVSINGGTPSYHPFIDGIFPCKPSSYGGTPIYGNLHMQKYLVSHTFFLEFNGFYWPIGKSVFLRPALRAENVCEKQLHSPGLHKVGNPMP